MNYKRLIISLALPQLAGLLGSFFTAPAISTWYASLQKPGFTPPSWLFGPMWIVLYILMGISIYLIWQKLGNDQRSKQTFWLFWIHLIFNANWSLVFFGMRDPAFALVNIVIIWLLIIVLMVNCLIIPVKKKCI